MAWKPKEKQLTPEEAIDLAKKELAPYWFGSPPLLVGLRNEGKSTVHPLDPSFGKQDWLIFIVDPSDFAGESVLVYAREWYRRYHSHQAKMLLVLLPPYQFFRNREGVTSLLETQKIGFPIVVDHDGSISEAFGTQALPRVFLLHSGKYVYDASGPKWQEGSELAIQKFLRLKDPGLPLLPPFTSPVSLSKDVVRLEFGRTVRTGSPHRYAGGTFAPKEGGYFQGVFTPSPSGSSNASSKEQLVLSGIWNQDAERIWTTDPEAWIQVRVPSTRASILAESMTRSADVPRLVVELGELSVYDSVAGDHITMLDNGQSVALVKSARLYHLLENLPERERTMVLRFPQAESEPLALYGLRFGN